MLVNTDVIFSVTLLSFTQCGGMDYPCIVTEWITPLGTRIAPWQLCFFNIANISLTSFAKKSELDDLNR